MGTQFYTAHHTASMQRLLRRLFAVPSCCMSCKTDSTLVGVPRVSPHPKARARSRCAPEATCICGTLSACLCVGYNRTVTKLIFACLCDESLRSTHSVAIESGEVSGSKLKLRGSARYQTPCVARTQSPSCLGPSIHIGS